MAKRKKKGSLRPLFIILIIIAIVAPIAAFVYWRLTRPPFVHYSEFGIDMPVNYDMHGIDVSKHQSTIGWEDVKQMRVNDIGVGFVFMKATEGVNDVDVQFKRNWKLASQQEIPRGAYHFFIATRNAKAQADNFIRTVDLQPGDLPPVLDVEQTYGVPVKILQQRVEEWLLAAEKEYGVKPIIYTNADFYKNYLSGKFDNYPLWVAHYLVKDKPRINRSWTFWQHSESGHVNGIDAFVDFNVFNGDSADFEALKIK